MNELTNLQSLTDEIDAETTKTHTEIKQKTSDSLPDSDSLWTNVWYGLGMLAFIVTPALIPGVSVRIIIIGYVSLVISIYILAGLITGVRTMNPGKNHKRRRNR